MNFWIWLLSVLETEMETPHAYGWYHWLWIVLISVFTVAMCVKLRDCSDKTVRRLSLIIFITLIIADLYRQIVFDMVGYDAEAGKFIVSYGWYAFPFQLCSSPHYILPFIIWMKDGKVRDACIGFMCFFSLLGGLSVFVYPESCFTYCLGVNIQTMLHHGMQIFLGVFYAVHERRRFGLGLFKLSVPVFIIMLSIAMVMNVIMYNVMVTYNIPGEFNMFYVSPYYECTLPLVGWIQPLVPYPVFLFLYILTIISGAFVIYSIMQGALIFAKKRASKRA